MKSRASIRKRTRWSSCPFWRVAGLLTPYDAGRLVLADRHTYEVAANWKVIAENCHECYHCPLGASFRPQVPAESLRPPFEILFCWRGAVAPTVDA